MDVFEPGHQFGDFDFQLQDNDPGISQSGLFWTMPIPPESANLDFGRGLAAFCLTDAQMPDMGNLLASIWGGGALDATGLPLPPIFPSSVSLDARWLGPGPRQKTVDATNRFVYDHTETSASIRWTSFRRGSLFASDNGPQQVLFAAIGRERNGEFLQSAGDEGE
jgi:hypothetical protein